MNKIVNVDNTELEALKQMAMEMALRLNVLQGESLLNEKPVVRKVWPIKREANENEILIGKFVMVVSFVAGISISAACGAGINTPFFGVVGLVIGLLMYAVHFNLKTRRALESTK
jgi:uncharacterized membrane protein YoaK (UPF0700 family)